MAASNPGLDDYTFSDPTGTISITDTFLDGLLALPNSLPEQSNRTLTLQLGKLDLVVPFQERMLQLNVSALAGGESNDYMTLYEQTIRYPPIQQIRAILSKASSTFLTSQYSLQWHMQLLSTIKSKVYMHSCLISTQSV
jgi:hypothetical protein